MWQVFEARKLLVTHSSLSPSLVRILFDITFTRGLFADSPTHSIATQPKKPVRRISRGHQVPESLIRIVNRGLQDPTSQGSVHPEGRENPFRLGEKAAAVAV